jgi:hypothetical protein
MKLVILFHLILIDFRYLPISTVMMSAINTLLLFSCFFLVNAYAFSFERCGVSGSKIDRVADCEKVNFGDIELKNLSGFRLVSVTASGIFLEDPQSKLVWSPRLKKTKGSFRCRAPYKKARLRHYRKIHNKFYKKIKGYFRCVSSLNDYVLIPDNRYLYFKK